MGPLRTDQPPRRAPAGHQEGTSRSAVQGHRMVWHRIREPQTALEGTFGSVVSTLALSTCCGRRRRPKKADRCAQLTSTRRRLQQRCKHEPTNQCKTWALQPASATFLPACLPAAGCAASLPYSFCWWAPLLSHLRLRSLWLHLWGHLWLSLGLHLRGHLWVHLVSERGGLVQHSSQAVS